MDVEPLGVHQSLTGHPTEGCPGIALAETCRVVSDGVPLWPYHRARLRDGGCDEHVIANVEVALADAIASYGGTRTSRLRAHLEVQPTGEVSVEVERRLSSLDVVRGPLVADIPASSLGTPSSLGPCASKPADRSWWDAAAAQVRRRGAHQALICDAEGFVLDGSSASVWVVIGEEIITPPAPPAVAGVARRFLLDHAAEEGLCITIRGIRLSEIDSADEVFLTNAFGGAVAVRDRGGPMTVRVQALFAGVWPRTSTQESAGDPGEKEWV